MRHGINGLIIDPWNELDHSRNNGMSETEQVGLSLSRIRHFARQNDLHVWIVAHPTKLRKNDDGSYPVPTPYDISGSAHFRNKADNCLTVYRLYDIDKTELHIQKIRFDEIGKTGMTELFFEKHTGRFYI